MLGLEVMSLFLLGLLGAALPAAGASDDDDDDKSTDDSAEPDARAPAAEEVDGEGESASLLDYAEAAPEMAAGTTVVEEEALDPWELEAEDAAIEDEQADWEADGDEADAAADLDVLAAVSRLTAASPAETDAEDAEGDEAAALLEDPLDLGLADETGTVDETEGEDPLDLALAETDPDPDALEDESTESEETSGAPEPLLAGADTDMGGADETAGASAARDAEASDDTGESFAEEEDTAPQAADDLSATTIVDYQPGSDQIEITIFAPAPDTAVDVILQQTPDGTGTEVLIDGKLRAILDGVLPGDVDANDLYIEFAG